MRRLYRAIGRPNSVLIFPLVVSGQGGRPDHKAFSLTDVFDREANEAIAMQQTRKYTMVPYYDYLPRTSFMVLGPRSDNPDFSYDNFKYDPQVCMTGFRIEQIWKQAKQIESTGRFDPYEVQVCDDKLLTDKNYRHVLKRDWYTTPYGHMLERARTGIELLAGYGTRSQYLWEGFQPSPSIKYGMGVIGPWWLYGPDELWDMAVSHKYTAKPKDWLVGSEARKWNAAMVLARWPYLRLAQFRAEMPLAAGVDRSSAIAGGKQSMARAESIVKMLQGGDKRARALKERMRAEGLNRVQGAMRDDEKTRNMLFSDQSSALKDARKYIKDVLGGDSAFDWQPAGGSVATVSPPKGKTATPASKRAAKTPRAVKTKIGLFAGVAGVES
jgi:hypothetical protein